MNHPHANEEHDFSMSSADRFDGFDRGDLDRDYEADQLALNEAEAAEEPVPADHKRYWLRIARYGCAGLTEEQYDAVADYAARSAIANPKEACGVWHAAHVVLSTPKCFCRKCQPI